MSRNSRHQRDDNATIVVTVGGAVAIAYLGLLGYSIDHYDFDIWAGLAEMPVILTVVALIVRRYLRSERDVVVRRIVWWGIVFKIVGTALRYGAIASLYSGRSDAQEYSRQGERLAPFYRHLDFSAPVEKQFIGTGFIRIVTGCIYALFGSTKITAFAVFSMLSFFGMLMLFRAFTTAVPDGNRRIYAALLFLVPSMWFWPSTIGKEAWMTFALGLIALGSARLLVRRHRSLVLLGLGFAAAVAVRPHIALLAFVGFAAALLLRRPRRRTTLVPMAKVGVAVIIAAGGIILWGQVQQYLDFEDTGEITPTAALDEVVDRTSQGGSEFTAPRVTSPLGVPIAIVTVTVRPFPNEADTFQAMMSSLEGLVLLGLLLRRWRAVRRAAWNREAPYSTMAFVYWIVFAIAFSSIGNFGILVRQRTQVLPFVAVVIAAAAVAKRRPAEQAVEFATPETSDMARSGPPADRRA
jgi:hypothetical protein